MSVVSLGFGDWRQETGDGWGDERKGELTGIRTQGTSWPSET